MTKIAMSTHEDGRKHFAIRYGGGVAQYLLVHPDGRVIEEWCCVYDQKGDGGPTPYPSVAAFDAARGRACAGETLATLLARGLARTGDAPPVETPMNIR